MVTTEQQLPPFVQRVDPPLPVWIDIRPLYKPHTHSVRDRRPDGLDIEREVAGMLLEWAPSVTGDRLGKVTYPLITKDERWSVTVTHYVPGHLIRRMRPGRLGRDK